MGILTERPLPKGQPALDRYYAGEIWAPTTCAVCRGCWLVVHSANTARLGRCIHSGPFSGFYLADPSDPPVEG